MITIAPGTLPTPNALHAPCRAAGVTAATTLEVLRALLRKGRTDDARRLLNAVGFDWSDDVDALPDAGMQEAIDAVQAALEQPCERCRSLGFTAPRVHVCAACRGGEAVSP